MVLDVDKISEIIVECAESYILPRFKALQDHEIRQKTGPKDLVTQADLDVEAHLKRVLPDFLPGSLVIGEESVSSGEDSLDLLSNDNQPLWIVDPVDGTYNFAHGNKKFGVMLACIIKGITQFAWIYDVPGEEMLVSERGNGAFIGKKRLKTDTKSEIDTLSGHINPRFFPKQYQDHIKQAKTAFKSCHSLGCAAHEYNRIAKGLAHFSIYSRLKPWDHLPGALIVEEAGGYCARWDGGPYLAKDSHVGLIVAASKENWQSAFDIFLKSKL